LTGAEPAATAEAGVYGRLVQQLDHRSLAYRGRPGAADRAARGFWCALPGVSSEQVAAAVRIEVSHAIALVLGGCR